MWPNPILKKANQEAKFKSGPLCVAMRPWLLFSETTKPTFFLIELLLSKFSPQFQVFLNQISVRALSEHFLDLLLLPHTSNKVIKCRQMMP